MTTVLFEDGDWRICRIGHSSQAHSSSILHKCRDKFNLNQEWWHISHTDWCEFCSVKVPDPIRGLFILHTWDRP